MNILWMSWKDIEHPLAGGAEVVSTQIRERLVQNGHKVKLLTALYHGSEPESQINGVEIIRNGGRYGVYPNTCRYYKKRLRDWPDLIIDEMNTLPFASAVYARQPSILLTYQLAREVWFYQMPPPLSWIGYMIEPLYLRLLSKRYERVLTESQSTVEDLARHGFARTSISTFRVGIGLSPPESLPRKSDLNTILVHGSVRPMKRTLDAVKAFEVARDSNQHLKLVISGDASGAYGEKVRSYVLSSRHTESISVLGRISPEKKLSLMKESAVILVTSVKEGWGLIVTEANSQGTPAIVFDADGLRDSVRHNETGVIVPNGDCQAMGNALVHLLNDTKQYNVLRSNAWQWSKEFTFENSYKDFVHLTGIS